MKTRILSLSFVVSLILTAVPLKAQERHYASREEAAAEQRAPKDTLLRGFAVSVDMMGLVMKPLGSDYQYLEGALRVNLKNKYFPIVEVGYAKFDGGGTQTSIRETSQAPYFRAGCDINLLRRKDTGNRLYAGLRYGFTAFNFSLSNADFTDNVWHESQEYSRTGISCNAHWGELVFGLEAKIWRMIHLGWSARCKVRVAMTDLEHGEPSYIPGFGKGSERMAWGGTFNVVVDI